MALNGTISGGNYNNIYSYYLTWSASQNIENNNSTITLNWIYKKNANDPYGGYNKAGSSNINLNIGNVDSGYTRADFDLRNAAVNTTAVLKSFTRTISHNADGTLTINVNGTHNTGVSWGTKSVSGSITLDTIPRASKATVSGTLELGKTVTINTNRASNSFTHTIKYTFNNNTEIIAQNVGGSTTWTIPKSLANQIIDTTTSTVSIIVETYNNSTLIGSTTTSITISIPDTDEFKPQITAVNLSEAVSNIFTKFGQFIRGKSKISGSVSAIGAYGSTIKSYSVNLNYESFTSSSFTTDFLRGSGECSVIVTDSRGRQNTFSESYTCLDYEAPKILGLNVYRCDSDGTVNDEGDHAICIINCKIANLNNLNDKNYVLQYKKSTDTSYTSINLSNSSYELNTSEIIDNIDVDSSYNFKLVLTDYFYNSNNAIEKNADLGTGFVLLNYNKSGKGFAIGKVSSSDTFEVNLETKFYKNTYDSDGVLINNGVSKYTNTSWIDSTLQNLVHTDTIGENIPIADNKYIFKTYYLDTRQSNSERFQIAYPRDDDDSLYYRRYQYNEWEEGYLWTSWIPIASQNVYTGGNKAFSGRRIDSYNEYVKIISFGTLPNNGSKSVSTGLTHSNITVTKIQAVAFSNDHKVVLPLPFSSPVLNENISLSLDSDNNVKVTTGLDRSNLRATIEIYYKDGIGVG